MYARKSHGWLASPWLWTVLLGLPILGGLVTGAYVGTRATTADQETLKGAHSEHVRVLSQAYLNQFWDSVELIRNQVFYLHYFTQQNPGRAPYLGKILHWSEIEIEDGQLKRMRRSFKSRSLPPSASAAFSLSSAERSFDDAYFQMLRERLPLKDLHKDRVGIAHIQKSLQGTGSWLALGFPLPGSDSTLLVSLVESGEIFRGYRRQRKLRGAEDSSRAFIVNSDGLVLAHTHESYVNADFSAAPVFGDLVQPFFSQKVPFTQAESRSIDQLPVVAAVARPGGLPLAIVTERILPPSESIIEAALVSLPLPGLGFLFWTGALVFVIVWAMRRASELKQEARLEQDLYPSLWSGTSSFSGPVQKSESAQKPRTSLTQFSPADLGPARVAPSPARPVESVEVMPVAASEVREIQNAVGQRFDVAERVKQIRAELRSSREALRSSAEEKTLVEKFEADVARLRDAGSVASRLAEAASRLSASPTLYFGFHEGLKAAILHATSGFPAAKAPAGMSFPLNLEAMRRIESAAQTSDAPVSLSAYEPLAKLMLARLGVAHFEAWVLTGYSDLGRLARKPRVLGVLVILQSGVESVARHESLCRMMRASGLKYETTLRSP